MKTLSVIGANCCFTAAVIAVREGRYDAGVVLILLFAATAVISVLEERRDEKLVEVITKNVMALNKTLSWLLRRDKKGDKTDGEL